MSYTRALSLKKIKDYLAGAAVVGFDFETSPTEKYLSEERAALDAHKAAITGVSLSVTSLCSKPQRFFHRDLSLRSSTNPYSFADGRKLPS